MGLLTSPTGDIGSVADDIISGDITSELEESNSNPISNFTSRLGNGLKNIFGIFGFVNNVKTSIVDVYNLLCNTTEAPQLTMSFNHEYMNGTYTIIDLTWYAPYKNIGDSIICAFCYLGFIWYVFKHLHSILSGNSSISESYTDSSKIYQNEKG